MNTEIYFYKTNIDIEFYQEFEEPEIFVFRMDQQDTYIGSFNKNISILHRCFKRPAKIEYYGYLGKIVYTEEELYKSNPSNYYFIFFPIEYASTISLAFLISPFL